MSAVPRLLIGCAIAGLVLLSTLTGMGEACFTRAVLAGLRWTGLAATRLGPALFAVGSDRYLVNFWCTPAILSLCLLFLLGFAGQPALAYLKTALAFLLGASLLLAGNVVLSVHLNHDFGVAWSWAHRPGLVAVYLLSLGTCLRFLERLGRRAQSAARSSSGTG